jgi:uncharacterized membrane protein
MTAATIWIELLGAIGSIAVLAVYQLGLRYRMRRDPLWSVQSVNRAVRAAWVEAMMASPGNAVLAIQSLRNSVMASTLMASTAVILIIGVLNASPDLPVVSLWWQGLSATEAYWPQGALVKVLAVVAALFLSFFFFAMSVRSFNHVGYMITIPGKLPLDGLSPTHVTAHLERAVLYHYLGLRTLLFCIPLVFWFFGPHLMFVASIALVFALYRLDRAPGSMPSITQ